MPPAPPPATSPGPRPTAGRTLIAACLLFFLSGALGLGYELVWIKKAALVVGASQIALSTVLTAFFLGLGLGGYTVGRLRRGRRLPPLVLYALFEAALGLFALAFPWLFEALESAYGALHPLASGSAAALFALRFLLLFILFLPPTFLMGGTLPLLLDGLVDRDESIGPRTSFLYGLNLLGAVAGVLITSYLAIPGLGLNATSIAGGAANLTLGVLAGALFRRSRPLHPEPGSERPERFFPLAGFASGLLAMGYQVAWARYLSLFQVWTVHVTAVLLAVHLLALAAGSLLLAPLLKARWKPLGMLALALALAPFAVLCTLDAWRAAEYRFTVPGTITASGEVVAAPTLEVVYGLKDHFRLLSETLDAVFCAPLFQTALVVFLPAALLGTGLPALIAASARRASSLRQAAGSIVLWNALGSSAGSFAAGYALLPLLGLHWTLFSLGLGSLALSAACGWKGRAIGARPLWRPFLPGAVYGAALIALLGLAALREDVTHRTIRLDGFGRELGLGRRSPAGRPESAPRLLEVIEGPLNSSYVFEDPESLRIGSGSVSMALAYKQAPSPQAIQGHIPCLFYPGSGFPENCLGICLGSGQSFGALLLYPVRLLDVVEISSEVRELCLRHFGAYNHDLGRDSRVRFHQDDGRHFIERAPRGLYDVVSMEPPPPTTDGVASLYSHEFYSEVARVLRPGGVFMQWLPLLQVTPLDALGIIKTQAAVFPETFVVKTGEEEFMVVSYPERPRFPLAAIEERCRVLAQERLVAGRRWNTSSRHELATLTGVLSLLILGPDEVRALPAPVIYRDDRPLLSYSSGDRWLLARYRGPILSRLTFAALGLGDFSKLGAYFEPPLSSDLAAELAAERAAALSFYHVPDPGKLRELRQAFERAAGPAERLAHALALAEAHDAALAKEEAYAWVERAVEADPGAGGEERLGLARRIASHGIAVYRELTERWVARLAEKFPGSPLVRAMEEELSEFRAREARRLSGYLLPIP